MFKEILNPDLYHGKNKKRNFFEGWYFKFVDLQNKNVLAIIPGIFKAEDSEHSHSFIQILIGNEVKYHYLKFPLEHFHWDTKSFSISIEENEFSLESIKLNINNGDISLKGTLIFKNKYKWPDSILNPGSMGFYNYFTFMECYSQVCVVDGYIEGHLEINNKIIDFSEGKLYVEKNWGRSFPYSWIWIQSNSFLNSNASLTCSIGHVPVPLGSFRGFLVCFYYNNKFINFTSINRSKLNIEYKDSDVFIKLTRKNYELSIKTNTKRNEFILCNGPSKTEMIPLVNESLLGKVYVELKNLKDDAILFAGTGLCTGVEYGGDMLKIIK